MCRKNITPSLVSHAKQRKVTFDYYSQFSDLVSLPIISLFSLNLGVCFKIITYVKHNKFYSYNFYWFLYFFLFNAYVES